MLEAVDAHSDPPLEGDVVVDPTIVIADVPKNTSEVKPNLAGNLASSGKI